MGMTFQANAAQGAVDVANAVSDVADQARSAAETSAADAAANAQDAIAEIKRIMTELVERSGSRAVDTFALAGDAANQRMAALVDNAEAIGRDSLDRLSEAVAKRPVATLAVAAGVGLLIGLASRSNSSR